MALLITLFTLLSFISPFASYTSATIDGTPAVVYVADNVVKWSIGYMNVSTYDPRGVGAVGMIFLFPTNSTYCFWMKNTQIPLKIVWVAGTSPTALSYGRPLDATPVCGFGDKVLELRPDFPTPMRVEIGEQRRLH